MGLPKIDLPLFELKVPSTKQIVKYRPFTVKEEKILLIAQESAELDQVVLAIKQIINNCFPDVDIDKLAIFDLEYMLLALRIKSVSNNVSFTIKDPDTESNVELELDLEKIKVIENEEHSNQIDVSEDTFLLMRYPSVNELISLQSQNKETESVMEIMIACIEKIVSGEEVFLTQDFSKEQLVEFLDSLPSSTIQQLEKFFSTMPYLRHEIEYVNKEGNKKTFVLEGLNSFFL